MKNGICLLLIYAVLFCWISCQDDEIPFDRENLILGYWEFVVSSEDYAYTLYHMKRTTSLTDKHGSICFGADGNFTFRGAWGAIGQPTLFTGTWSAPNDTLIVANLAQPFTETWKMAIKKLDRKSLEYYYLYNK